MDAISLIRLAISTIIGSFIGHMAYDICKAHKTHKGNEKRKVGEKVKKWKES